VDTFLKNLKNTMRLSTYSCSEQAKQQKDGPSPLSACLSCHWQAHAREALLHTKEAQNLSPTTVAMLNSCDITVNAMSKAHDDIRFFIGILKRRIFFIIIIIVAVILLAKTSKRIADL
jgi:hypothetical protein